MNTANSPKKQLRIMKNKSKRKYLTALAVFLAGMYLMIFVEHFFENNGIANADTCSLENHEITHWLEGHGIVSGNEIIAYLTPAGRMLQEGDEMFVKAAGTDRVTLPISRLSYDAQKNIMTVYFQIDPTKYEEGAQVIVDKEQTTRKYPCIPAKAVHKDENGSDFVYLVQEKKSILGNELVCKMKYISIFLEDEDYAAVNLNYDAIKASDLLILNADREISDGSKIHLLDG